MALDAVTRNPWMCVLMWTQPCVRQLPCQAPQLWLPWLHLSDNLGASTHAIISDLLPDLSEPWFERLGTVLSDSHSGRTLPCLHQAETAGTREELGYERGVHLSTAWFGTLLGVDRTVGKGEDLLAFQGVSYRRSYLLNSVRYKLGMQVFTQIL